MRGPSEIWADIRQGESPDWQSLLQALPQLFLHSQAPLVGAWVALASSQPTAAMEWLGSLGSEGGW